MFELQPPLFRSAFEVTWRASRITCLFFSSDRSSQLRWLRVRIYRGALRYRLNGCNTVQQANGSGAFNVLGRAQSGIFNGLLNVNKIYVWSLLQRTTLLGPWNNNRLTQYMSPLPYRILKWMIQSSETETNRHIWKGNATYVRDI